MGLAEIHLAVLASGASHGYEIKRALMIFTAPTRKIHYGQVYATLQRLERDARIRVVGHESHGAPDRTTYEILPLGLTRLQEWLAEKAPLPDTDDFAAKVVTAMIHPHLGFSAAMLLRERAKAIDVYVGSLSQVGDWQRTESEPDYEALRMALEGRRMLAEKAWIDWISTSIQGSKHLVADETGTDDRGDN